MGRVALVKLAASVASGNWSAGLISRIGDVGYNRGDSQPDCQSYSFLASEGTPT